MGMQVFEQFCPKAGDAKPLVAEHETDFNAKWPFKVVQGHLFCVLCIGASFDDLEVHLKVISA